MSNNSINVSNVIKSFFNKNVMEYLFSFLAINVLVYLIIRFFYGKTSESEIPFVKSRYLNVLLFGLIFVYSYGEYSKLEEENKENYFENKYNDFKGFLSNVTSVFSVISFILGFYLIIYFTNVPMTNETKPTAIFLIDTVAWLLFIITLLCSVFIVLFDITIADLLLNGFVLDKLNKTDDTSGNDTSGNDHEQKDEVFNVSNNLYTYHDAPAVCSIYGARLATYDEVEDAYNSGGEWCNYGWSDGQMALFPTQKSTWSELQGSELTKNHCGRPGVNGGYMANPLLLFGVNCYGKKPAPTSKEQATMDANKEITVPKTPEDALVDAKTQIWKENSDKFLVLNSFNRTEWHD